jgi:hypothetical protein
MIRQFDILRMKKGDYVWLRVEENAVCFRCSLALSAVSTCACRSTVAPLASPPSQIPPCRITAAGSSSVARCTLPRMQDPWAHQRVPP